MKINEKKKCKRARMKVNVIYIYNYILCAKFEINFLREIKKILRDFKLICLHQIFVKQKDLSRIKKSN